MGVFAFSACNSSDKPMSETMECCKEAAEKGEKCEKCNHEEDATSEEGSANADMSEKECCATAKAEGKSCDKCVAKKACCEEAMANGKECSKCSKG